ncbi:MAG: DUF2333 family protein [Pseudomonadota bacterium]
MLDPVIAFFVRTFELFGRGIGTVISWLIWPFVAFSAWLRGTGWFVKIPVFVILLALLVGYGHMFFITQFWSPPPVSTAQVYVGDEFPLAAGEDTGNGTCQPSAMVTAVQDIIELNVNDAPWVPSNPLHKMGLFFLADWKDTPFFDNRAAFQLGMNTAVRRTSVELVDRLGRVRGTSSINSNLQDAREAANYRETAWFITATPPFFQPSTQQRLRDAQRSLGRFNSQLTSCASFFDTRADNLLQFLDRLTSDIGSTSQILQDQIVQGGITGFDRRADDRFWFTYGQLYGYYMVLTAARSDFQNVVDQRNLEDLWQRLDDNFQDALNLRPFFIANANASSLIKSHLESIGFALLRARTNITEIRDVLDR